MNLQGKHTVVFGLGKTGEALARFLLDREARVTVTDNRPASQLEEPVGKMKNLPVRMHLGGHEKAGIETADLIVLSPGVPHTLACLERARKANIPVIGEIELAWRFIRIPVVAITGTNGKSTTTSLCGRMLEHSGKRVFVGGNIGRPLIDYINDQEEADVAVAEISSFQLDTIVHFRPAVGVLLNITPDHLDRYPDFEAYAKSKARIFQNQTAVETAVVNAGDPVAWRVTDNIASRRCGFNQADLTRCGARVSGSEIEIMVPEAGNMVIGKDQVPMAGRHNLENTAAAAIAALAAGATRQGVLSALSGFGVDPHRLEYVASIKGVSYYDDSKGTNVDASARAIEAMDSPVILIAGGRDKQGGYAGLRDPVRKYVKALIVMGEAAEAISLALGDLVETRHVRSMSEAVKTASAMAVEGDKVLLSPACSSFDMYDNYAARGRDFQHAVHMLGGAAA
jgi:UDP-N-acetylmuramoylalanine--D-glutamate ligase